MGWYGLDSQNQKDDNYRKNMWLRGAKSIRLFPAARPVDFASEVHLRVQAQDELAVAREVYVVLRFR